jgi:signal transduction histidine kinase
MSREWSEVAERFGLLGRADSNERPGRGHGLKSKVLDFRHPKIRLWSRKITLLQQFFVYLFMVLGLTMVAVGTWMSARIEDGVLRSNAGAAALYMASFVEPHVQSIGDEGTLSVDDLANLGRIRNDFALRRQVESIKVWRPDGTILFSNQKELIGRKFSSAAIEPSLDGEIRVARAKLDEDDNDFERGLTKTLYEIFAPLYKNETGKIIAVAEFYQSADALSYDVTTVRNSWLIVGGSSLAMFIALFAFVYRGNVRIEQQRVLLKSRLREQARLRSDNSQLEKRMREALKESARIDDLNQRRLGAELHDGPAQLIALILLRLEEIESEAGGMSPFADALREVAAEALKEIRAISSDLFLPGADDAHSMTEVLRSVVGNHERRTNSIVTWRVANLPERVSTEVTRCVARVVQEALNNCFKHAAAADQTVSVTGADRALTISIWDSGPGITDTSPPGTEKLGLKGMRYRVEAVGGIFEIRSQRGNGTEIWCNIPVTPPE